MPELLHNSLESSFEFDLPRSRVRILAQQYHNGNWKVSGFNHDTSSTKLIGRSLSNLQLVALLTFLISAAKSRGVYGKTADDLFLHIKNFISSF